MTSIATSGVLITSDEQTIVFIMALDEQATPKFVLKLLDSTNVFVKSSAIQSINAALQSRLMETVFDEVEDSAQ